MTDIRPGRARAVILWLVDDRRAAISLFFILAMIVLSLAAPVIAPFSPTDQDYGAVLLPPSLEHPLGTDDLGRDVLSRLIHGAKASLYGALLSVAIACAIGVPIGLLAGFVGGWVDDAIGRLIDTLLSFPAITLAIAITGALGIGLTNGMIAVGVIFSPILARLARAQTLVVKNELYVDAARCFGSDNWRIIVRHVVPNAIQPVLVQVTLLLALGLLAEASLSFLGLGVQPPEPSWGGMLARAYLYMEIAPEQMYAPGVAIVMAALAFNALGESLRIALDPTMRRR